MNLESHDTAALKSVLHKKRTFGKWLKRCMFLIITGLGIWYFFGPHKVPVEYVTEMAQLGTVQEMVEVSGSVESKTSMDLRFRAPGQIANIFVTEGQHVKNGDVLMELDAEMQLIELEKAKALVDAAQAELDLAYAGPKSQEVRISQTEIAASKTAFLHSIERLQEQTESNSENIKQAELEVSKAEDALANAEIASQNAVLSGGDTQVRADKSYEDILEDAKKDSLSALDDVTHAWLTAESILGTDTPEGRARQSYLGFKAQQKKISSDNALRRIETENNLLKRDWQSFQQNWNEANALTMLDELEDSILESKALMDDLLDVLLQSRSGSDLTASEIAAFKTSVKSEQASLASAIDSIRGVRQGLSDAKIEVGSAEITKISGTDVAQSSVDNARHTLEIARNNLEQVRLQAQLSENAARREIENLKIDFTKQKEQHEKLLAKPRAVDVASLQARVNQQIAAWKQARKSYNDMRIVSPVDGIVTLVDGELGENIDVASVPIKLMTEGLQIRANIPETDIDMVEVGNPVSVTLDALSLDQVFSGTVVDVDPAETVIQGVVYYQIIVGFDGAVERIKSGMTSDLEILVGEKTDVVTVSPEAIRYEENRPFVYVLEQEGKKQRFIKAGLEGGRSIEVTEGLSEGDRIVLYETESAE